MFAIIHAQITNENEFSDEDIIKWKWSVFQSNHIKDVVNRRNQIDIDYDESQSNSNIRNCVEDNKKYRLVIVLAQPGIKVTLIKFQYL